jgi:hypothetical protein
MKTFDFLCFLLVLGMIHGVCKDYTKLSKVNLKLSNFANVLGEIHKKKLYIKKLGEKYHNFFLIF